MVERLEELEAEGWIRLWKKDSDKHAGGPSYKATATLTGEGEKALAEECKEEKPEPRVHRELLRTCSGPIGSGSVWRTHTSPRGWWTDATARRPSVEKRYMASP